MNRRGMTLFGGPSQKKQIEEKPLEPEQEEEQHVPRLHLPDRMRRPRFGQLYDDLPTTQGWRYLAQYVFDLTNLTCPASPATLITPLTIQNGPPLALEQWPGAARCYMTLVMATIGRTTTPGSAAMFHIYIQINNGLVVPIGLYFNTTNNGQGASVYTQDLIFPTPITDPGNPNIGNLIVTSTSGTTALAFDAQVILSPTYFLPDANMNVEEKIERFNEYGK